MKTEFIQEVTENDDLSRFLEGLSGWETIVFELEDDPDSEELGR